MTKANYIKLNNITIRKVTAEDKAAARTDYQRNSEYIVCIGANEYYSQKPTLADLQECVQMCNR